MIYGDFKTMVLSFLGKNPVKEQIPTFINLAKLNLQRQYDFAATRSSVGLTYSDVPGLGVSLPSDFKNFLPDHSVALILSVGIPPKYIWLEATTEERERRRLFDSSLVTYKEQGIITSVAQFNSSETTPIRYYMIALANGNNQLQLVPPQPGFMVNVDYYAWLPPYSQDTEEDFFLQVGFDCLLWETLKVANNYVFEEDRVAINAAAAQQAFEQLMEYDASLSRGNAPIDLG